MEPVDKRVNPEINPEVNLELSLEFPEEMEDIGGIHERIQSELLNQEKEDISRAMEILCRASSSMEQSTIPSHGGCE